MAYNYLHKSQLLLTFQFKLVITKVTFAGLVKFCNGFVTAIYVALLSKYKSAKLNWIYYIDDDEYDDDSDDDDSDDDSDDASNDDNII